MDDERKQNIREALELIVVRDGERTAQIDALLRLSMGDLDRRIVLKMIQSVRLAGQVDGILMMLDGDVGTIIQHVHAEAQAISTRLQELVEQQIENEE